MSIRDDQVTVTNDPDYKYLGPKSLNHMYKAYRIMRKVYLEKEEMLKAIKDSDYEIVTKTKQFMVIEDVDGNESIVMCINDLWHITGWFDTIVNETWKRNISSI